MALLANVPLDSGAILSAFLEAKKRLYLQGVVDQSIRQDEFSRRLSVARAGSYRIMGDQAFFAVEYGFQATGRYQAPEVPLGASSTRSWLQGNETIRTFTHRIDLSGAAADVHVGENAATYINALSDTMRHAVEDAMLVRSVAFWQGLGNGKIASVGSTYTGNSNIPVSTTRLMFPGMYVDFRKPDGSYNNHAANLGCRIVSINSTGSPETITVAPASGTVTLDTSTYGIYVSGSFNAAPPCIETIIDNQKPLHGIDPEEHDFWKAYVLEAPDGKIGERTIRKLLRMMSDGQILSGSHELWTSPTVVDWLIESIESYTSRQIQINVPPSYQVGTPGASENQFAMTIYFGDKAFSVVSSPRMPNDTMYCIDFSNLEIVELRPLEWSRASGDVFKQKQDYDAVWAYLVGRDTLITRKRRAHGKIVGITGPDLKS